MPTIPTQQQPFPSSHSHLKHQQQYRQQLLVRPATTSTPSSMPDQNPRRKPPEESSTHHKGAMNTMQPAHIPHAGDAAVQGRKQSMEEMSGGRVTRDSGFASQESLSMNTNMDSSFNSVGRDVGMGVPSAEEEQGDFALGEWKMSVGSSGVAGGSAGSAPETGPGVLPPAVEESSGAGGGETRNTDHDTPEDWVDGLNQNVSANNFSAYDGKRCSRAF